MMLMAAAVGLFALMDALAKGLMEQYPLAQVMFFRGFGVMIPLMIYSLRTGGLKQWKSHAPRLSLICSLCMLISMVGLFYSFKSLPLTAAYTILYTMPIWAALLAVPMLGEKLGGKTLAMILVGFGGVVIMINPLTATWQGWGIWAALVGTIFYALWVILVRRLSTLDSDSSIVFSNNLMMMVAMALPLPWVWRMPENATILLGLVAVGVMGGVAQIMITAAFRSGPTRLIVPFEYSSMLWVVLLDWLFWHILPGPSVFIGAVLVIASGLWFALNEATHPEPLPAADHPAPDPHQAVQSIAHQAPPPPAPSPGPPQRPQ